MVCDIRNNYILVVEFLMRIYVMPWERVFVKSQTLFTLRQPVAGHCALLRSVDTFDVFSMERHKETS